MKEEEKKISSKIRLILLGDFNKYNFESNKVMNVSKAGEIEKAIEIYEESIDESCYFNIILSDYKKKEDAFKLLNQFLKYNNDNLIVSNNS